MREREREREREYPPITTVQPGHHLEGKPRPKGKTSLKTCYCLFGVPGQIIQWPGMFLKKWGCSYDGVYW